MKTQFLLVLICIAGWGASPCVMRADQKSPVTPKVADALQPTVPDRVGGILGERLDAWRQVRLWRVVNDPFLLDGFLHPPGKHPWQGEHVGKWLHAASLAAGATDDPKLDQALRAVAAKLVAAQEANGYLGTYAPEKRFYNEVQKGALRLGISGPSAMPSMGYCPIAVRTMTRRPCGHVKKQPSC